MKKLMLTMLLMAGMLPPLAYSEEFDLVDCKADTSNPDHWQIDCRLERIDNTLKGVREQALENKRKAESLLQKLKELHGETDATSEE